MRNRRTKAEIAASKGLGDTIEKITTATGIKAVVKFIAGEDCGCDERKAKLNKLFPYKKPLCLTEIEYNYLKQWFEVKRNSVKPSEQRELLNINNRIFQERQEPTTCVSCLIEIVDKLKKVYQNYEV